MVRGQEDDARRPRPRDDPGERQQHAGRGVEVEWLDNQLDAWIWEELIARDALVMRADDDRDAIERRQLHRAFDGRLQQRTVAREHGELLRQIVAVERS